MKNKKTKRPGVKFLTPSQLAGEKEYMWTLVKQVAECDETYWKKAFDSTNLYAVYLAENKIIGFSSVMEQSFVVGKRRIFTIGLGQTLVLPEFRNQFLVQRALIYRWWRAFTRSPFSRIYIWGSCISYKSYLSFVKVLKVVYPHPQLETDAEAQLVMRQIGEHWYGQDYDPQRQLVYTRKFRLVDESVLPTEKDLVDDFIRFYMNSVPPAGTDTPGLLTLSPCVRSNFLPMVTSWMRNAARKALGRKKKKN